MSADDGDDGNIGDQGEANELENDEAREEVEESDSSEYEVHCLLLSFKVRCCLHSGFQLRRQYDMHE